ncbi:MAG: chemotaxis protein CheW, partial [Mycobacteriales bacterium]
LSAPAAPLDRRARLVVLHREGVSVGVLTEGVEGTALLDDEQLETALAHLPATAADLLAGQTTDAEGPCGVLDLDAVYRLADALPRARRAG